MDAECKHQGTITAEMVAQWLVEHNLRLTALELWRELNVTSEFDEQVTVLKSSESQRRNLALETESAELQRILTKLEELVESEPPTAAEGAKQRVPPASFRHGPAASSTSLLPAANVANDLLLLRLLAERLPTLVVSVDPASREVLIPLLTMVALRHPAPSVRCSMLYQLVTLYRRPSNEQIGSIVEGFEDWVARAPRQRVASEALPEIWNLTSQRFTEQRVLAVALLRVLFARGSLELSSGVMPVVKDMLPAICSDMKAAVRSEAAKVFPPLLSMLLSQHAPSATTSSEMNAAAPATPAAAQASEELLRSVVWTHAMNSLIALVADESPEVTVSLRTEWAVLLQTLSSMQLASQQRQTAAATMDASPNFRDGAAVATSPSETEAPQCSLLGGLVSVTVRVMVQAMYEAVRSATTTTHPPTASTPTAATTSSSASSRVLVALSLCLKIQRMLTEVLLATTVDDDTVDETSDGGGVCGMNDATAVELVEWLLAFVLNALPSAVAADAMAAGTSGGGGGSGGVVVLVGQLVVAFGHAIALMTFRRDPSALHALVLGCSDALAAPPPLEDDLAHDKKLMTVERKRLGVMVLICALGMLSAKRRSPPPRSAERQGSVGEASTPRRRDGAPDDTAAVSAQSLVVLVHVLSVISRALHTSEAEPSAPLSSPSAEASSPTLSKPSSATVIATAAVSVAYPPGSLLVAMSAWEASCTREWVVWVVKAVEHVGGYVVTLAPSILRQAASSASARASTWERGWDQFTIVDALWTCSASRDTAALRMLALVLMRAILLGAAHAADRLAAVPPLFEPGVLVTSCLWPQLTALIDDVDASVQIEAVAVSVQLAMELLSKIPRLQVKILRSIFSFVEGVGPFSLLMETLLTCCREHFAKCSAEVVEEHLYDLVGGTVVLMTSALAASAANANESPGGAKRWLPSVVAGLRFSRSSSRSVDDAVPKRLTTMLNLLSRMLQAPVVTPRHVRAHLLVPVEGLCQLLDRNVPPFSSASAVTSSAHSVLRAVRAITDRGGSLRPQSSQKTFLDKMRDEIKRIV